MSHNNTGIKTIPGVNHNIVAVGTEAMLSTYVQAFRYVWLSAIPFLAVAAIGTYSSLCRMDNHYLVYGY